MSMLIPSFSQPPRKKPIPSLENGDRLTREEYERRYEAMPHLKRAELIEGEVYMSSPVRVGEHGLPHGMTITWLGYYHAYTPGVLFGDNTTVRLDTDNEVQPDGFLLIEPLCGGQAQVDEDGYVMRGPELIGEVSASTVSYDLHAKFSIYRRNEVREYVVWRVLDEAIDWFVLRAGQYQRLEANAAGTYQSEVFPGLWLDTAAMIRGDLAQVLAVLQQGIASPEHAAFVTRLQEKASQAQAR
jgi:Uma2 family endonuclease